MKNTIKAIVSTIVVPTLASVNRLNIISVSQPSNGASTPSTSTRPTTGGRSQSTVSCQYT
jgi:hypothetical protein